MKKYFTKLITYSFFAAALLLAACESPLKPLAPANSMDAGTGQVRVLVDLWAVELPSANIADNVGFDAGGFDAGGPARTMYPGKVFDHYVYIFTKSGGPPEVKTPDDSGVFTLAAGSWTLAVQAYATSEAGSLAATGSSAAFTVTAGALNDNVTVSMTPVLSDGQGTLSYSVTYPDSAELQTLNLMLLGGGGTTSLLTDVTPGSSTTTGTKTALAAGYYLMSATLADTGKTAGKSEVVHIGKDLTTNAEFGFTAEDFTEPPPFVAVSSISGVPGSAEVGVNLTLSGTVAPANATNRTIAWSVKSAGGTGASISGSTLHTSARGTVTITATIANGLAVGTNYTQEFLITVSNPTVIDPTKVIDLAVLTTSTDIQAKVNTLLDAEDECKGTSPMLAFTVKVTNANFSGNNAQMWRLLRALNDRYVNLEILSGTGSVWPDLYENDGSSTTIEKIISLTLPATVTALEATGSHTPLSGLTGLRNVSLPGVTAISIDTFKNRTNLISVSLPAVDTIPDGNADRDSSFIPTGVFAGCTELTNVDLSAATSIGMYAFYGCASLTSVTLPSATSIGSFVFSGCTALTSVSLPAAISIGVSPFYGCDAIESMSFDSLENIPYGLFSGRSALKDVSLAAATSIRQQAFSDCTGLTSVTLPATAPTKESNIFYGIGSSSAYKAITIRVPIGSISNYSTSAWPRDNNTTAYGGYVNVTFVEY